MSKYYEKFWTCPACNTGHISALRKLKCPGCGHVKAPQDQEDESRIEIIDSIGLALAMNKPHWTCSSCMSVNLATSGNCIDCGDPREADDRTNKVIPLGPASSSSPAMPVAGYYRPSPPEELPISHHHLAATTVYITQPEDDGGRRNLIIARVFIGLILTVLVSYILWAVFHKTPVRAEVIDFRWVRTVQIEQYRTIHDSSWSTPAGAYNISSSRRLRDTEPVYETREWTERVEKTCRTDMGNGSVREDDCSYDVEHSEEVKVGEREIYADWYEYTVDLWQFARSVRAEGRDRDPYWPEYILVRQGSGTIGSERVSSQPAYYDVVFRSTEDKSKEFLFAVNFADWTQYEREVTYPLWVNSFGVVNDPLRDRLKE